MSPVFYRHARIAVLSAGFCLANVSGNILAEMPPVFSDLHFAPAQITASDGNEFTTTISTSVVGPTAAPMTYPPLTSPSSLPDGMTAIAEPIMPVMGSEAETTFVSVTAPETTTRGIWTKNEYDDEEKLQQFLEVYFKIRAIKNGGPGADALFSANIKSLKDITLSSWRNGVDEEEVGRSEEVIETLISALSSLRGISQDDRINALKTIERVVAIMRPARVRKDYTERFFQHMLSVELMQPEPVKLFCTIYPTEASLPVIDGLTNQAREMIPHALLHGYLRTRVRDGDEQLKLFRYIASLSFEHSAIIPFFTMMAAEIEGSVKGSSFWMQAIQTLFSKRDVEWHRAVRRVMKASGMARATAVRSSKSADDADLAVKAFSMSSDDEDKRLHWHYVLSGLVNNSGTKVSDRHLWTLENIAFDNPDENLRMKSTCVEWLQFYKPESAEQEALKELKARLDRGR